MSSAPAAEIIFSFSETKESRAISHYSDHTRAVFTDSIWLESCRVPQGWSQPFNLLRNIQFAFEFEWSRFMSRLLIHDRNSISWFMSRLIHRCRQFCIKINWTQERRLTAEECEGLSTRATIEPLLASMPVNENPFQYAGTLSACGDLRNLNTKSARLENENKLDYAVTSSVLDGFRSWHGNVREWGSWLMLMP